VNSHKANQALVSTAALDRRFGNFLRDARIQARASAEMCALDIVGEHQ